MYLYGMFFSAPVFVTKVLLIIWSKEMKGLCWTNVQIHPKKGNLLVCFKSKYLSIIHIYHQCLSISLTKFGIGALFHACQYKTNFHRFCLSTDYPVLTGERVSTLNGFSNISIWTCQQSFLILKTFLKINQLWKTKLNCSLC